MKSEHTVATGDGIADELDPSRAVEGRIAKLCAVAEKRNGIELKLGLALGYLQNVYTVALVGKTLYNKLFASVYHRKALAVIAVNGDFDVCGTVVRISAERDNKSRAYEIERKSASAPIERKHSVIFGVSAAYADLVVADKLNRLIYDYCIFIHLVPPNTDITVKMITNTCELN
jgi:hypothetical protein